MQCEEAKEVLHSYIAGYLTEEPTRELERHITTCAECSRLVREARQVLEETGSFFETMLPESPIEERVLEGVAAATMRYEKTWTEALREQWQRAPWWMISAAVHAVILMLMTVITVATAQKRQDDIVITTDLAKKKEPEYDEKKIRDIFRNTKEVEAEEMVENPVFVHEEVEVTDHFETENDMDTHTARGQEDAISDIPLGGTGVVGNIGVGGGGAGCFGYRSGGGRRRAIARFGGSKASESAVDAGLRWLARHQEPDGSWDCDKYLPGTPMRYGGSAQIAAGLDSGVSGLALLAFLGAGHTTRAGRYRQTVGRSVKWMLDRQKNDGDYSHGGWGQYYCHMISTLAMAETYGMTRDQKVGYSAQKGIDLLLKWQEANSHGGWSYYGPNRVDSTVAGWAVMALKSAKVAGLDVPKESFVKAAKAYDMLSETTQNGYRTVTGYTSKGGISFGSKGYACTGAGLVARLFMGYRRGDPETRGAAEFITQPDALPKWTLDKDDHQNMYYWYYGTLGLFQMGGDYWKVWNSAMRDMLIQHQRRGGDEDGSWDPSGVWGAWAGRVYSTSLGCLCLEVYYRYLPVYKR